MSTEKGPALTVFDPVVAGWFERCIGQPTETQARAWPEIAAGGHVLVTAPTGSGKTLTAFLWAINQLLAGIWSEGGLRVLYVSPLKALNNDIQRNLLQPLAELEEERRNAGLEEVAIGVKTRSGDTSSRDRQAILRNPPEILITTPESLNLLLTSPRGREIFRSLRTVILDEIHAVAGSKRGTHLMTAVERLVPLAGEFQRVALSATVRPAERMAAFVGGYEKIDSSPEAVYRRRPVRVVSTSRTKKYSIEVCRPDALQRAVHDSDDPDGPPANLWEALAVELRRHIDGNRSTLVFANNRRTTEKLTRLLNDNAPCDLVYSHHGSLSREIRTVVENRLRNGDLRGLVATNSLELGIDIGTLDEVLLVKTPPSVSAAVQRIGRAGHQVGATSRGRFYPLFGRDLLEAAVVAQAVERHDIEEIEPIEGALDVLAQVILSMVAHDTWPLDELFDQIRCSYPYRALSRRQFDLVIEMLAGRYSDSRVRELEPRLSWDRLDDTVRGRPGTPRLVYQSGGTIPDRGYFHLRLHDSMAKLGELDEEFVWERSVGDTFTLGAQAWKVRRITHSDVLVSPVRKTAAMAPFWRAEERDRSFHLSERIGAFLERADGILDGDKGGDLLARRLEEEHRMTPVASAALVDLLQRQRAATGGKLPHRHLLVIERSAASRDEHGRSRVTLHTGWGGRVNRPFAIALAAAWEDREGFPLEIEHDNDCVLMSAPGEIEPSAIFDLVRADNVEELLRKRLESTGFFGARFRENAGRALLLPRSGLKRRVPLWLQRERGKKLLKTVGRYPDFPIVVETWRSCLHDAFEIERLKGLLSEIDGAAIALSEVVTDTPSPFSADLRWKQTNRLMYEDDTPEPGTRVGMSGTVLKEVVFSSRLRPRLPAGLIDEFESKLQRLHAGYAPCSPDELVEWVKERVIVPEDEWVALTRAVERDCGSDQGEAVRIVDTALPKLTWIETPSKAVIALESIRRIAKALEVSEDRLAAEPLDSKRLPASSPRQGKEQDDLLETLVGEWLRHYGPLEPSRVARVFGLSARRHRELIESLGESEQIVVDSFRAGDEERLEICDAHNLERLLRLLRSRSRMSFEALPLERLPLFLAAHQGLTGTLTGAEGLKRSLEQLLLLPVSARLWESEILPARLDPYYPEWLDSLMQESELLWAGYGSEKSCFGFAGELELMAVPAPGESDEEELSSVFADPLGRYGFSQLLGRGDGSATLSDRLWRWAWSGWVSNTTYAALRKGVLGKFSAPEEAPDESAGPGTAPSSRSRRRPRFERWKSSRPFSGDWFRLLRPPVELDALEEEELTRERVRILLDRYGILFRELLGRELPALGWGSIFRSLRLMELSGEVLSGHFFSGVYGPQFISRRAFRLLSDELPEDVVFWLNAADPASPCGLGLEEWRGVFPSRTPSNHLVFHGDRLVVVSRRSARDLEIRVAPDHPELVGYLDFLKVRLGRRFAPVKSIDIESINQEPAAESPYAAVLKRGFHATRNLQGLRLRRRY